MKEENHTPAEEKVHVINVLRETQTALAAEDAAKLKELSNQTIHCASYLQDSGSITLAVVIYTLSKLIERSDHAKATNWKQFSKKFNSWMLLAIKARGEEKTDEYEAYLEQARKSLTSMLGNLKPYIQEVLLKASINKASRIYEHGISLGKTAQLLGVTQWELSEYAGQKKQEDGGYNTFDVKKRAKMALEFLS